MHRFISIGLALILFTQTSSVLHPVASRSLTGQKLPCALYTTQALSSPMVGVTHWIEGVLERSLTFTKLFKRYQFNHNPSHDARIPTPPQTFKPEKEAIRRLKKLAERPLLWRWLIRLSLTEISELINFYEVDYPSLLRASDQQLSDSSRAIWTEQLQQLIDGPVRITSETTQELTSFDTTTGTLVVNENLLTFFTDPDRRARILAWILARDASHLWVSRHPWDPIMNLLRINARRRGHRQKTDQLHYLADLGRATVGLSFFNRFRSALQNHRSVPPVSLPILLSTFRTLHPDHDLRVEKSIERAYALAIDSCLQNGKPTYRSDGETLLEHATHMALHVARMGRDADAISAALLAPFSENLLKSHELLDIDWDARVAQLVHGLHKLEKIPFRPSFNGPTSDFTLENALNSVIQQVTTLGEHNGNSGSLLSLLLADKLQTISVAAPRNMKERELKNLYMEAEFLYAPLAERLGDHVTAGHMRNEAFRALYPDEYQQARNEYRAANPLTHKQADELLSKLSKQARHDIEKLGIPPITIRHDEKTYASAWKKKLEELRERVTGGGTIAGQLDLNRLMIVVESEEDLSRIRDLDRSLGTPLSDGDANDRRVVREILMHGRLTYRISVITVPHPDPQIATPVKVEVQIMTRAAYEQYLFGQMPVRYRWAHWKKSIKRSVHDFFHRQFGVTAPSFDIRFSLADPPLSTTGRLADDLDENLRRISASLGRYVFPASPVDDKGGIWISKDLTRATYWEYMRFPKGAVALDWFQSAPVEAARNASSGSPFQTIGVGDGILLRKPIFEPGTHALPAYLNELNWHSPLASENLLMLRAARISEHFSNEPEIGNQAVLVRSLRSRLLAWRREHRMTPGVNWQESLQFAQNSAIQLLTGQFGEIDKTLIQEALRPLVAEHHLASTHELLEAIASFLLPTEAIREWLSRRYVRLTCEAEQGPSPGETDLLITIDEHQIGQLSEIAERISSLGISIYPSRAVQTVQREDGWLEIRIPIRADRESPVVGHVTEAIRSLRIPRGRREPLVNGEQRLIRIELRDAVGSLERVLKQLKTQHVNLEAFKIVRPRAPLAGFGFIELLVSGPDRSDQPDLRLSTHLTTSLSELGPDLLPTIQVARVSELVKFQFFAQSSDDDPRSLVLVQKASESQIGVLLEILQIAREHGWDLSGENTFEQREAKKGAIEARIHFRLSDEVPEHQYAARREALLKGFQGLRRFKGERPPSRASLRYPVVMWIKPELLAFERVLEMLSDLGISIENGFCHPSRGEAGDGYFWELTLAVPPETLEKMKSALNALRSEASPDEALIPEYEIHLTAMNDATRHAMLSLLELKMYETSEERALEFFSDRKYPISPQPVPRQNIDGRAYTMVKQAIRLAEYAHEGQRRKWKNYPYLVHPLEVAYMLVMDVRMDDPMMLIAALLHDYLEDGPGNRTKIQSVSPKERGRMLKIHNQNLRDLILSEYSIHHYRLMEILEAQSRKKDMNFETYIREMAGKFYVNDLIALKLMDRLNNLSTLPDSMRDRQITETLRFIIPHMVMWEPPDPENQVYNHSRIHFLRTFYALLASNWKVQPEKVERVPVVQDELRSTFTSLLTWIDQHPNFSPAALTPKVGLGAITSSVFEALGGSPKSRHRTKKRPSRNMLAAG